ncbi:MAG: hypothetical protein ASARMPRED_006566 [Alectoria sarmentosa]|nr:MAG: hypothetical protein ASARMPRED_006566 [Alectoria sarmentosa]
MASTLPNGLQKVMDRATSQFPKLADMAKDTKDSHDSDARPVWPGIVEGWSYTRDKTHHFGHERIPERIVHARGAGAFGTFKLYESAEDVTSAGVWTDTSRTTPVFLRFSTVLGSRDRGISRSYRIIQGFGVNTYTLANTTGERLFVKLHFTPTLGVHSFVWDEALKLAGQDPEFHRKNLRKAISQGEHDFDFDILDTTKVWPEEFVPIRYIGELELNCNVEEYFTQTEQAAFATGHAVPGIGFSDDCLLQGVREAFGHLRAIRATGEAGNLVKTACEVDGLTSSATGSHDVVIAGVAKLE